MTHERETMKRDRKGDREVRELACLMLARLGFELGMTPQVERHTSWVIMRLIRSDGTIYLQAEELGYRNMIKALEKAQARVERLRVPP